MNRYYFLPIAGCLLVASLIVGCSDDLLDKTPKESLTSDFVWSNPLAAEQFVNGIYADLTSGFQRESCTYMLDAAADDGDNSFSWTSAEKFNFSTFGPANSPLGGQWADLYKLVRKANLALANLNNLKDATLRDRLKGETYFLRGYLYFELLRFYGTRTSSGPPSGVPIIDRLLTAGDNYLIPRSSYDETVDFIVKNYDSSAFLLPNSFKGTVNEGRATKGAALALKGRLLLYAERWSDAAAVSKELIDNKATYGYDLFPKYYDLFLTKNNQEVIFVKKYKNPEKTHNYDQFQGIGGSTGGWGGLCPTQELVDEYEMIDGKKITNSPLYDPSNPYDNRDPRFEATILHNGSMFKGEPVETFLGGKHRLLDDPDRTKTGYYARKYFDDFVYGSRGSDTDWIYMRFGEVLLNYAEAQNEIMGPDASVYEAIQKIRDRVNMPPLAAGLSKDQMREAIQHERRVEFAFEEHRFFDVRRWGIANQVLNRPFYSMMINKTGSNTFTYQLEPLEIRVYQDKNIVLPIPQEEIDKNPEAVQVAGW